MKYSNYFRIIINDGGIKSLSSSQIGRMMNIIFLEGQLAAMNKLKNKFLKNENLYKFDLDIHKIQDQLNNLTGEIPPKELMHEMMKISWKDMG